MALPSGYGQLPKRRKSPTKGKRVNVQSDNVDVVNDLSVVGIRVYSVERSGVVRERCGGGYRVLRRHNKNSY